MIVVPVSGGKDSQACLQLAIATGDQVVGHFNNTKFEHPATYDHIRYMEWYYGVPIHWINEGASVETEVLRAGLFPGLNHRFCTKNLKIRPSKRWYKQFAIENGPFEVWIGVRKSESAARKKRYAGLVGDELIESNEFMEEYPKYLHRKYGIMFRLPIIDWSTQDVFDYLDGNENPLYAQGFDRVGCFPCLAAGDKQMVQAFNHDDFGREQYKTCEWLAEINNKRIFRDPNTNNNGCSICNI